ncbi:MAG: TRAP transporter fused permease subunit [Rhodospirillaceae bacterium]|nr:TRAP transporter fused permease subunit [Rhodospirillaceae bacterium]
MTETNSASKTSPPSPLKTSSRRGNFVLQLGASMLTVLPVMWALDIGPALGLNFYPEQLLAAVLGLAIGLVFLNVRIDQSRGGAAPWYDIVASLVGFATMVHVVIAYERLLIDVSSRTTETSIIGIIVVILVMEGMRRTAGSALFLVVMGFILYALAADLVPGDLEGRPVGLKVLFNYLALDTNSVLGIPMKVGATIVIMFILMGQLLFAAGGGDFFTDLASASMGRRRGGSAKIAVIASALFGSISGTAVSNVASTGVITIPMMRRSGYGAIQSGAIEAVASTGGQLMPPIMGAAAFLIAEFLEIDYVDVIIAAALPALLYYFAIFIQVDLLAAREKITVVDEDIPSVRAVLSRGWHFLIPFLVLLYAMFGLMVEPEVAALYAAVFIVISGMLRGYGSKRLRLMDTIKALSSSGMVMLELFMILAGAGFVIGVLNITGLGGALAQAVVNLGDGILFVLLIIAAVICIILGMGMPTVGVYILLATMVAPAIIQAGVPQLAAHMFILYFGMMSMITPPIAMAAFAAATISKTAPMATGWASMKLGWVAYVIPFMFVISPPLLMQGAAWEILLAIVMSMIGVYFFSVTVIGYFSRGLDTIQRALLAAAGIGAMVPYAAFQYGVWINAVAIVLGTTLLVREKLVR